MSASPTKVNGTARPSAMPVMGDWQPIRFDGNATVRENSTPAESAAPEAPARPTEPTPDPVAAAKAEAIRAEAWAKAEADRQQAAADAEERRIRAEAEAKAIEIKATDEAERLRITNERAAMRLEKEREENAAKVAELKKRREAAEREAQEAEKQAEDERVAARSEDAKREKSAKSWRHAALGFAIACGVVALPVQMSAFWNPDAKWLLAAPVMLEGGAWVVLRGAAAAVDDHRPHWHYRLIAWALAFIAAGVNLSHGLSHFDPATAIGTAFASLAGPGVWDLHEHGRIRKRDGVPTRREIRAKKAEEKRAAAEKAAAEKAAAEKQAYLEKASREAAEKLAEIRSEAYPKEWAHALKLAAAFGETAVSEPTWRRAYRDINGADPGESAEVQKLRNAAARSLLAARSEEPDKAAWKITAAQVNPQVPPTRRRGSATGPPVRGVRRPNDTPKYSPGALKQASIAAKKSASTTND
jgi:chemotaxis protein histidine kinase CheA